MQTKQMALMEFQTPSMPFLDVERCYTKVINYETAARMVKTYHYAHRVPSIVIAVGMYVDDVLAGCITYGIPPGPNTQRLCGEKYRKNTLELNRLFIFDWVGYNSESWLIGQSFAVLKQTFPIYLILVSYADLAHNHIGYIYQATNWLYTGLGDVGGGGTVLYNGQEIHSRKLHHTFGTRCLATIKTMGHNITRANTSRKHRYVYFLGDRRQRRKLRKALKWSVLPYPKGENDATD